MAPLGLEHCEDPSCGLEGSAAVRRQVRIPIATSIYPATFHDLGPAMRMGTADIVLTGIQYWAMARGVS